MSDRSFSSLQPASPTTKAVNVTILYEDFDTGSRARQFADSLAEALSVKCQYSETLWRLEILEFPPIADEAARGAEDGDFIILSLRGDAGLSTTTKHWLEEWLVTAGARGASVVCLFDSHRSVWRHVEGVRCYLRNVAKAADVAFFAYGATGPGREDSLAFRRNGGTDLLLRSARRREAALLAA